MKRRQFIKQGATGLAVGTAALLPRIPGAGSAHAEDLSPRRPSRAVDTHTHFYDPSRPGGVPWPAAESPLHRTVLPDDWEEVAAPHGVAETVVVEASPWVEDNQWVLDLAEDDPRIVGLVGNLDPLAPDFAALVERFAPHPLFCGLRWRANLVDLESERGRLLEAARIMADNDLSLDLNGPPRVLRGAAGIADAVPSLRIVVNHLGGPGDPSQPSDEWRTTMRELAARPAVHMKVSALVEQNRSGHGMAPDSVDHYRPVLDAIWEDFGEDRVLFGSNWPVSDRGAPYATLHRIVLEYFSEKGEGALEKYFWSNSFAVYRWRERGGGKLPA